MNTELEVDQEKISTINNLINSIIATKESSKRVILTGIGGFIGAHCLEYFLEKTNWTIIGIDSFRHKGTYRRLDEVVDQIKDWQKRVKIFNHDLSVPIDDQLFNLIGDVDIIINMASDSAVERSTTDPVACLRNNYDIAINMLEFARKVKPTIFFQISTDEVYGEAQVGQSHKEWAEIMPSNPYCLLPESKILTDEGLVEIQNIDLNKDRIFYNHRNYIARTYASNKFKYQYEGNIRNITTSSGDISATDEHKFFRNETHYSTVREVVMCSSNGNPITRRPYKKVVETAAKDLKVGDYVKTVRYLPFSSNTIKIDDRLARFLGYFIGDGSYSNKSRYVRLADQKLDYIEYYQTILRDYLGVNKKAHTGNFGTIYKHSSKDCWYLQFACEKLRDEIDLSNKKDIIDRSLKFNHENTVEFLAGFFDAEAYFKYDANNKITHIDAYQKNKYTLEIIQLLLRRIGVISRIRKSNSKFKNGKLKEGWKLLISDAISLIIFFKTIPCRKIRNDVVFPKPQSKNSDKNIFWARISKITDKSYKGDVYDLEIPKYHNYVAEYYVVHNSASKAAQEAVAIAYWRTYDVPVVITNCMNIIGERQNAEKFLPKLIQKIVKGEEMPIYGDSEDSIGTRFYLHAKNKADALIFLSDKCPALYSLGHQRPDRYNICGDVELNNLEMGRLIAKIIGKPLKYKLIPSESARKGYDKRYGLDGTKLRDLGWVAPISFEDSLKGIISWTLENKHWMV